MTTDEMAVEGWRQINGALGLITWSRLAAWNPDKLTLVAAEQKAFESYVSCVHGKFGRLICWIEFGVGAEYLVRGSFMLKAYDPTKLKSIVQPPEQGDNILEWIKRVNLKNQSIRKSETESCMKFGGDLPWTKILTEGPDLDLVAASMKLLAGKIRNRDAHRYAENVRAFHFNAIGSLFVPAFNILLASMDQDELRKRQP